MGAISAFLRVILWRRAGKTYTFVMSYSHGQFAPENTTETRLDISFYTTVSLSLFWLIACCPGRWQITFFFKFKMIFIHVPEGSESFGV